MGRSFQHLCDSVATEIEGVKACMEQSKIRIAKLEDLVTISASGSGDGGQALPLAKELKAFRKELEQIKAGDEDSHLHRECIAVIGGLKNFDTMEDASEWLRKKLYNMLMSRAF